MNVGSLFTGIGGLDLGLERAGWSHAFLCESLPYRRRILKERFPGTVIARDVREVTESWLRRSVAGVLVGDDARADARRSRPRPKDGDARRLGLLAGGFPCKDVSVAGKRGGLAGAHSGLFYEFVRVAEALRPRRLLIENVPGLLSSNGGRDFGVVLGELADLGYGLAWRILDSRYFGVPQRRRRVFVVGTEADGDPRSAARRSGEILALGNRCERHPPPSDDEEESDTRRAGRGARTDRDEHYWVEDCIDGPLRANGSDGKPRTDRQPLLMTAYSFVPAPRTSGLLRANETLTSHAVSGEEAKRNDRGVRILEGTNVRRLTPTECERLQALPDGWTKPGSDTKRYAAIGDAVTVTVAEWIGRRLLG